jgi:hypothetical protein
MGRDLIRSWNAPSVGGHRRIGDKDQLTGGRAGEWLRLIPASVNIFRAAGWRIELATVAEHDASG